MKERIVATIKGWIEDPNPILLKELRATFRTPLFARFLYVSTGLVSLLVLATGAVIASGDVPPATVGQVTFQLFFASTLLVICVFAPGYASATITNEREQRTWESLQLSGMSAPRIIGGKFVAAYASIALVIVALSPVSGTAFLFGGVAPTQVVVGLLSMLVALAPAIAFGIALSARVPSTRIAIALATLIYSPIALVAVTILGVFGELAQDEWHLAMEGPFFYTDAFATRPGEWDTWLLLIGGPIYAIGMSVWFLLASAIAGVRPMAENRSGPLKRWAVVMTVTTVIVVVVALLMSVTAHRQGTLAVTGAFLVSGLTLFYAILFTNEPPLPPRPWENALRLKPAWRRGLGAFGPGAAGTLRFSAVWIVVTAALVSVALLAARHIAHPSLRSLDRWDVAVLVVSGGMAVVALFVAAFGTWMRMLLRHGFAARVVTLALLSALTVGPVLLALILDPDSLDRLDRSAPLVAHFSAFYPMLLAGQIAEHSSATYEHLLRLAVPVTTYGLLAVACWATVEARVRAARKWTDARRASFAARAPKLPRLSRPSIEPPLGEEHSEETV